MIQRKGHRMNRPKRLPAGRIQVFKLHFTLQSGKADIRPQPGFRMIPRNPGILLLFLFPGIVASYRYSQAVFCLLDDPDISPFEAIRRSKRMMQGHKMELFSVQMSFIGWMMLRVLVSNGIGYAVGAATGNHHFLVTLVVYLASDAVSLVLFPYMQFTFAQYYNYLTGYGRTNTENGPEILF